MTKDGGYEYYQVSASVLSESNYARKIDPLESIKDNYPKYILTLDQVGLGNVNGIEIVNLIDWLLNK